MDKAALACYCMFLPAFGFGASPIIFGYRLELIFMTFRILLNPHGLIESRLDGNFPDSAVSLYLGDLICPLSSEVQETN